MFQTEALKTQLTEEQQRNVLIMVTKEVVKSVEKVPAQAQSKSRCRNIHIRC